MIPYEPRSPEIVWSESGTGIEHLCDNGRSIRADGISSPDAQSHRLTRPSARPADPRNGRGLVVRGSDE